jgi:hypothetical protein
MVKNSTRWYDPGSEYPWLLPVPTEEEPPQPQPTRKQLDLTDLLASQPN